MRGQKKSIRGGQDEKVCVCSVPTAPQDVPQEMELDAVCKDCGTGAPVAVQRLDDAYSNHGHDDGAVMKGGWRNEIRYWAEIYLF